MCRARKERRCRDGQFFRYRGVPSVCRENEFGVSVRRHALTERVCYLYRTRIVRSIRSGGGIRKSGYGRRLAILDSEAAARKVPVVSTGLAMNCAGRYDEIRTGRRNVGKRRNTDDDFLSVYGNDIRSRFGISAYRKLEHASAVRRKYRIERRVSRYFQCVISDELCALNGRVLHYVAMYGGLGRGKGRTEIVRVRKDSYVGNVASVAHEWISRAIVQNAGRE